MACEMRAPSGWCHRGVGAHKPNSSSIPMLHFLLFARSRTTSWNAPKPLLKATVLLEKSRKPDASLFSLLSQLARLRKLEYESETEPLNMRP